MNRFTSKATTLLCGVLFLFSMHAQSFDLERWGVKQFLGKLDETVHESGAVFLNPLTTTRVGVPIRREILKSA